MFWLSCDNQLCHEMILNECHHSIKFTKKVCVECPVVYDVRTRLEAPGLKRRLLAVVLCEREVACVCWMSIPYQRQLAQDPQRIVWIVRIHALGKQRDFLKRNDI